MPGRRTEIIAFSVLAGSVWIYLLIRALFCPIVHDEAVTFYAYIQTGHFLGAEIFLDANNHLLNSFLTIVSYKLLGNSEFALRLPNLLMSILYFYFLFKISGSIRNGVSRWVFIVALCLPHFIIEFFAYSRGYGMSMSFMMAGLYHLLQFSNVFKSRHVWASLIFSVLSVSANLSLINTHLLICLFLTFSIIRRWKICGFRKAVGMFIPVFVIGFLFLILFAAYAFLLKNNGNLYYGSDTGFYSVTVNSLSKVLFRTWPSLLNVFFAISLLGVILFFGFSWIGKFSLGKIRSQNFVFPFFFFGNIAASVLLALLFKVNYPEDRAGMYFYILFSGMVCFTSDIVFPKISAIRYFLFLPFVLVVVQFFLSAGISFSSYTPEYRIPFSFYDVLIRDSEPKEFPVTVEAYQIHKFEWAYYNYRKGGNLNLISFRNFPSADADYVISNDSPFPGWENYYSCQLHDDASGYMLLKRNVDPQLQLIYSKDAISHNEKSGNEFYEFFKIGMDTLKGKSLLITFDMDVISEAHPFEAYLGAMVRDASEKELQGESVDLDLISPDWSSTSLHKLKQVLLMNELDANSKYLLVFFCDKRKTGYEIVSGKVNVYAFEPPMKKLQ